MPLRLKHKRLSTSDLLLNKCKLSNLINFQEKKPTRYESGLNSRVFQEEEERGESQTPKISNYKNIKL